MSKTGNLSVHTENIFPIIKKFLYSDNEIFLRELVSNAVDACQKLKMVATNENVDLGEDEFNVEILVDKDKKTIKIIDNGIGLTEEEVEKYINQIAFSSAEEFVKKYENTDAKIIGHFGLGFYSSFMVAHTVEINSLSYKPGAEAIHWSCEGSTTFSLDKGDRTKRGTEITLHIAEDSEEFLDNDKIRDLLNKYCRFMPVVIYYESKKINETQPNWTKSPASLTDEDYKKFYTELYPFAQEPLFSIHLNVDYPFNLTGILYFPQLNQDLELKKNKIHLYSNQVFVTDNVEQIVPDYLTLLHGIIDSPDIPLNVSRSYLQADSNVKKISAHIVKKVTDKLAEIFKNQREEFEKKWDSIAPFVKIGMLSDSKFEEKAKDFTLIKNVKDEYYTLTGYIEKVKDHQTDKDKKIVLLYTSSLQTEDYFIKSAQNREYDVLVLDHPLDSHFVGLLERIHNNITIKRVDSDSIEKLVDKGIDRISKLQESQINEILELAKSTIDSPKYEVRTEALSEDDAPVVIVEKEFMRRMKEMSRFSNPNGNDFDFSMNEVVINTNAPVYAKISLNPNEEEKKATLKELIDLARLSRGLLTGTELTEFVNKQFGKI